MSYIAAWEWFDEFQRAARIAGDVDRQRLSALAYQAWRYQDANQFTEAFETFRQGADLARRLHERCWELFFDYWCAQGMLYHTRQIQGALDARFALINPNMLTVTRCVDKSSSRWQTLILRWMFTVMPMKSANC
jgi:hypothetical protein